MESILAISPIDGRYKNKTVELSRFCSEFGLISYRVKVEIEYLMMLSGHIQIGLRLFTDEEKFILRKLKNPFKTIAHSSIIYYSTRLCRLQ